MKILISDKSSPKCAEILQAAGHEVDEIYGLSPEELKNIIGIFEGLIVRSATKVTAEIINAAKKLKVIEHSMEFTGMKGMVADEGLMNSMRVMRRYLFNSRVRNRMKTMDKFFKTYPEYFGYGIYIVNK